MRMIPFFILLFVGVARCNIEDNPFLQGVTESHEPICEAGGSYTIPHEHFCDRYYLCFEGAPVMKVCGEGLAYATFVGCRPLVSVDCSSRPRLRDPKGSCLRPNGVFADLRGCGRFIRCTNGHAKGEVCPRGAVFDVKRRRCRRATHQEQWTCFPPRPVFVPATEPPPQADLTGFLTEGFQCPDPATAIYPFGTHSRHPYPHNCQYFVMCLKDGSMKVAGCEDTQSFNPVTNICEAKDRVACVQRDFLSE